MKKIKTEKTKEISQNLTGILEDEDLKKYTNEYLEDFKKDLRALNIPTDPKHIRFVRVSEKINEIKKFINLFRSAKRNAKIFNF